MTERLYRTQILLEPEQHRMLAELAQREGRSVSELVREMIRQQLERRAQAESTILQRRLGALDQARRNRDAIQLQRGGKPMEIDIAEEVRQMRGEGIDELINNLAANRG